MTWAARRSSSIAATGARALDDRRMRRPPASPAVALAFRLGPALAGRDGAAETAADCVLKGAVAERAARCGIVGPIGQLDLRGRFGAFFSGKGHAHRFDFLLLEAVADSQQSRRVLEDSPCRLRQRFEAKLSHNERHRFGGLRPKALSWCSTPPVQRGKYRLGCARLRNPLGMPAIRTRRRLLRASMLSPVHPRRICPRFLRRRSTQSLPRQSFGSAVQQVLDRFGGREGKLL